MSRAVRFAVLASGRGSNFAAIAAALKGGLLRAECVGMLTDKPGAGALEIARSHGIATNVVPAPDRAAGSLEERRLTHDRSVLAALAPWKPEFLVMAGYMRVVTPALLDAYRSPRGYTRIVNIHPSLLPAFPGVDSYAQAHSHGCKVTGATVHLVEDEVDAGPICAQEAFSIADCRSVADVEARGLAVEHRLYPATLAWVLSEEFEIEKQDGGARSVVRRS